MAIGDRPFPVAAAYVWNISGNTILDTTALRGKKRNAISMLFRIHQSHTLAITTMWLDHPYVF